MLREVLKNLSGRKRKFILLRIADMDTSAALKLCSVVKGTYNSWLHNPDFITIYRRRDEFAANNKQEAIQLLRRDNQLEAVLLEGKIIAELKRELEERDYNLMRSHLAKEVYSRLISELDVVPSTQVLSWEQRVQQIFNPPVEQLPTREAIEGEYTETVIQHEEELEKSLPIQESKQALDETEEENQE